MEKEYYFIFYRCKRFNSYPDRPNTSYENECQDIIDIHPIQFQIDCNEKYGQWTEEYGSSHREEYMVISWQKLTKEEYDKYNGHIG